MVAVMAISIVEQAERRPVRLRPRPTPGGRRYLLCPPAFFDVVYSINPWMDPRTPVDRGRAQRQWEDLVAVYRSLGHDVEFVDPVPGLPDMVFAANSALVLDGRVLLSRFRHRERRDEEGPYREWFVEHGYEVMAAAHVSEGEGDFLSVGPWLLAGWGIRTAEESLREVQEVFGRPVVGLRLIDARYYHLDTALVALDDETIAYYPPAFSPGSRRVLERLFPDAIRVAEADAHVLGLNAVSDGRHVVLPGAATGLAAQLRERGFEPVPVDVSELLKAGGSVKCCTLELRGGD
jgi:N-dimethylarginine dimethylaminohydrolase